MSWAGLFEDGKLTGWAVLLPSGSSRGACKQLHRTVVGLLQTLSDEVEGRTLLPAAGALPVDAVFAARRRAPGPRPRAGPVSGNNTGGVWRILPSLDPFRLNDLGLMKLGVKQRCFQVVHI